VHCLMIVLGIACLIMSALFWSFARIAAMSDQNRKRLIRKERQK